MLPWRRQQPYLELLTEYMYCKPGPFPSSYFALAVLLLLLIYYCCVAVLHLQRSRLSCLSLCSKRVVIML